MSFSTMCPFGWTFLTHLPCGFHPLPDAEVAHDPGDEQAQSQVPVQRAHVVEAWGNPQRSPPAETGNKTWVFIVVFRTVRYHWKEVRRSAELTPRTRGQERWRSGPLWPTSFSLKTPHSFLGRRGEEGQNVETLKHIKNIWWASDAFWTAFLTRVPCVVAGRPGQVPGEGERQVENPPGQNDDVVEVQQNHDHLGAIAKTCRKNTLIYSTENLKATPVELAL